MYYRGYRAILAAFGAVLLLWLLGVLAIALQRSRTEHPLRKAWSVARTYNFDEVNIGSEGGIYTMDYRYDSLSLRCLDPASGQTRWDFPLDGIPAREGFVEQSGILQLGLYDGRMLVIDSAGKLLWQFEPQPDDCQTAAPQLGQPQADLYSRNGRIIYGLTAGGELCWALNTGMRFGYGGVRSQVRLQDKPVFILNGFSMALAWPDGTIASLPTELGTQVAPELAADGTESLPPLQLSACFDNGDLLLRRGDDYQVYGSSGDAPFTFAAEVQAQPSGAPGQLCPGEGEIMFVLNGKQVAVLDTSGQALWNYSPDSGQISEVWHCAGCFILLVEDLDNLTRSVSRLAQIITPLGRALFGGQRRTRYGLSWYGPNHAYELHVLRDGKLLECRSIPFDAKSRQNILATPRQILLVGSDHIECFTLERQP